MLNYRFALVLGLSAVAALSCSDDDDGGDDAQPGPGGSPTAGAGRGGAGGTAAGAASGGSLSGGTLNAVGGSSGTAGAAASGTAGNAIGGSAPAGGAGGFGGEGNIAGDGSVEAGSGGTGENPGADAGAGGEGGGAPSGTTTCTFPEGAALGRAAVPEGFCAWEWAAGLDEARGITTDEAGNVLVVARAQNSIVALWDANGDGVSGEGERVTLVTQSGLNHGIYLHDGYLYASSATTVYRWPYAADRTALTDMETLITGIPNGGHVTRTLAVDDEYLYVSVGSSGNVDPDSERARIRRFEITTLGSDAIDFDDGEVFADGLRNEVGLRFDSQGRLWGVENGRDRLEREDLGGDITEDNPAEELNLFAEPGKFYGYPYCWTEYLLPEGVGLGRGTQWADPSGARDDAWCRDTANVVRPVLSMQAHAAPLDLLFYPGGSFPSAYTGDLFVTFHGSWNREEPTGYKVMHIPFGEDGAPSGEPVPFLEYSGTGDMGAGWPHRPVGLTVLPNGVLLVTSDASDRVLAIGYEQ